MEKGVYAFAAVGVMQVANKMAAFAVELLAQGAGGRVADQLLDAGQRIGGEGVERCGQAQGLAKGDRVAVMMPNVPQYPVVVAAVLRAGLVLVNVNPLYTARELAHQLKDSGAKAIVILENFAGTLERVG